MKCVSYKNISSWWQSLLEASLTIQSRCHSRSPRKSHDVDDDDDDEAKESDADVELEKLKTEATKAKPTVNLEHVEKSDNKVGLKSQPSNFK